MNILNNQYQQQFTEEVKTNIPQPEGDPSPTMPDINVATEGIQKLLQKLNVNKASGPDMLSAMILKELTEVIPPSSAHYIRNAWRHDQALIYGKQQMSQQYSRKVRSLKPIIIGLSP